MLSGPVGRLSVTHQREFSFLTMLKFYHSTFCACVVPLLVGSREPPVQLFQAKCSIGAIRYPSSRADTPARIWDISAFAGLEAFHLLRIFHPRFWLTRLPCPSRASIVYAALRLCYKF